MPAPRRAQSSTMLYPVVVFVVLFLVAAVAAVAYYMKYEQQRKVANDATDRMREMAKEREWQTITQTVGQKDPRDSYLATLLGYVDDAAGMILGKPLEQTSAELKLQTAKEKHPTAEEKLQWAKEGYLETLNTVGQKPVGLSDLDPNTIGLTRIAERLKAKLTDSNDMLVALNNTLQQLQGVLAETKKVSNETQRKLIDEKEQYRQQVEKIKKDYDQLSALTKQTSSEQIQTIITERDQAGNEVDRLNSELMQMEAKLKVAHDRLEDLQKQVWSYMGPPDSNVPAYKPDGHIMLVDNQIVHIDIGTDDRVYRGLTFAVYDKATGIHKDGRGKAEIEVFDVRKNVSQARVIRSKVKRPIVVDDIVANLIWDSDKTYNFVVQGEFDLNGDGQSEYDAVEKMTELIERWGGRVVQDVSVDTDYVVLGEQPRVLKKPTFEDMEADPTITEKYEASVRNYEHYNQVQKRAAELWIPVFNTERFLYFIGYKTLAARPTAFLSKTTD